MRQQRLTNELISVGQVDTLQRQCFNKQNETNKSKSINIYNTEISKNNLHPTTDKHLSTSNPIPFTTQYLIHSIAQLHLLSKQTNKHLSMMQSHSTQQPHFSFRLFSIFSQIIQLSIQQSKNETKSLVKQLQEEFTHLSPNKYQTLLFNLLKSKAIDFLPQSNKQETPTVSSSYLAQSLKSFLTTFSQTKTKIPNLQAISQHPSNIKLIIADKKKLYSIKQQITKRLSINKHQKSKTQSTTKTKPQKTIYDGDNYRAYVIYGKAMNVQRCKKTNITSHMQNQTINKTSTIQDIAARQQTIHNLQHCMTRMYQQHRLPFSKCQPNQLQDLILTHPLDDPTLLPIFVTNQVYKYFVPLDAAIVIVLPGDSVENNKQQVPFIFKDTLLHVFYDNSRVLQKIVSREQFFKNTAFRGVYFVEEGEVETKSGRIVARGWVTSGKCKSTTLAWKFTKIMAFFKFILENQNIWKQFVNDLKLNGQWPIKVSDILNLDEKLFQQIMGQQDSYFNLGKSNQRLKKLKFPPISGRLNYSFDAIKLMQIEKMKHFDERKHQLHEFKKDVFQKKMQHGARNQSLSKDGNVQTDAETKQIDKKIHILSQKMNLPQKGIKTDVSRSGYLQSGQSSSSVLISGIVRKLKSMHVSGHESGEVSPGEYSRRRVVEANRSKTKILGLRRYEQMLRNEKQHLFKGKNQYN